MQHTDPATRPARAHKSLARFARLTAISLAWLAASGLSAEPAVATSGQGLRLDGYRAVPMERLVTGHQVVQASINGHPVRLIVDTGAEQLVVDLDSLGALGVDSSAVLERDRASGIAGPFEYTRHPLGSLQIDGRPIDADTIMATGLGPVLAGLSGAARVQIHGILGQAELLAHQAVMEVEPDRLHLRFADDEAGPVGVMVDDSVYRAIPMSSLGNGMLALDVRVEEHPTRLLLDTGASRTVLDARDVEAWALAEIGENATVGGAGGEGRARIRQHRVARMAIGEVPVALDRVASVDFAGVTDMLLQRGGEALYGVIGLDVLRRHRAVIDLGVGRMYLTDL